MNDYITGDAQTVGHPQAVTPNVNKLAQSGVAFRHAYSNHPVCAPLDGYSVRPFLENPKSEKWDGPDGALTTIFAYKSKRFEDAKHESFEADDQHWVYRTKRWRYIRYHNGLEELYDHDKVPYECTNLADNPEFRNVKTQLHNEMMALRSK